LGELKPQETILIHAAGSGVGTAAIQLASRKITDANIIATAGSKHKLEMAKALGAQHTINYKKEDFAKKVLDYTNGHGADVILDFVGASYWEQNLKSAAIDGRWILIGTLGGAEVEKISISDLMKKRLSLKGTLLTPRSHNLKVILMYLIYNMIIILFYYNFIQLIILSVLSFEDLTEAYRQMENSENTGKIIIQIVDD